MNPIEQQHAAQKEISSLVEAFEAKFDRIEAYDHGSPLNITVYVPPAPDARIFEHAVVKGFGESPEEAISHWKDELARQPQAGRLLFWRVRPEVQWSRDFRTGRNIWGIYSRLAVVPK